MGAKSSAESSNTTRNEAKRTSSNRGGAFSVSLNVYEPKESANRGIPAFQIFHSGVEVHGTEYVFGGGGAGLSTGIFTQRPKWMPSSAPWKYKESISLGFTNLSKNEVGGVLREMKSEWTNSTYDLTGKNCNHFSDAFAKKLGCTVNVPGWLNRAARVGNMFRGVVGKAGAKGQKDAQGKSGAIVDDGKHSEVKEASLNEDVDVAKAGCLNEEKTHPLASILKKSQGPADYLQSDTDEQLLIVLPFKRIVKPRQIRFTAKDPDSCPKDIRIFVNMPNLDFEEAEDAEPTVGLTMENSGKLEASLKLPASKFNLVNSLTIYVVDNHGADKTILKGLEIIGRA